MRIGLPTRPVTAALIAATVLGVPLASFAEASGPYYDRSFMLAAHRRCGLFAPTLAAALDASTHQARGAATRAGVDDPALKATAERARALASRTACSDPQLALARDRVADAFLSWSRTPRMTFPGGRDGWTADRGAFSSPTWRLAQASFTGASPVTFGITASPDGGEQLEAVVSFVGRPRPYAARIVLRSAERSPRPWPSALPPPAARRTVWAASAMAAAPTLLAADRKRGQAWVFPAHAADALARLDPREPFVVEFLFRDDSVAQARFEAGDFTAGRAFIAMGSL